MECFYEQFQTKNYGKIGMIINILIRMLVVFLIVSALMLNWLGVIFFGTGYVAMFFVRRNILVEYEYELTNEELVISKIIDKRKRKNIAIINVKDIVEIKNKESLRGSNIKIIKAFLDGEGRKNKVYIVQTSLGPIGYQLALDEDLVKLIRRLNPIGFINI